MKEAVGETAMTIITITLVAATIGIIAVIIGGLLGNQKNRSRCENAGYVWTDGACMNGGSTCIWNDTADDYICN